MNPAPIHHRRQHSLMQLLIGLLAVTSLCLLTACPDVGLENAPGSPPRTTTDVSYGGDIQPIWDKNCVSCHRTDGIADGIFGVPMHLTFGQSFIDLVNQPSAKSEGWTLVVPREPEMSLLFRKVRDEHPPFGARMPLFQPGLLDAEIELIRQWIEAGAPNN